MNWLRNNYRLSRRAIRRTGISYIELVLASASSGALMLGLASVLFTTNKAFDAGDTSAGQRIKSAEVLGDVMNDVRHAISFTNRTANSVTFSVPDRDGDLIPEKITYSWSGTAGDPLLYSVNGGTATAIADDVHNFDLNFVSQFMLAPNPPPMGGSRLLFVVDDELSLSSYETGRQALVENWGYEVTLISAADPQAEFDTDLANNDVVLVSADVSEASLGTKLTDTTVGVLSENSDLTDEIGFAVGSLLQANDEILISTDNHYITSDFAVDSLVVVLNTSQSMATLDSPVSPHINTLAESSQGAGNAPSLVTLEPGDTLHGGAISNGRRVQVPWGAAIVSSLTGEGQAILKRGLEWASGAGPNSPAQKLLMVVNDVDSLTTQELQRKALLVSWGYKPTPIAATDSQANFDAAVAGVDIGYIHAAISDNDLGTKLLYADIGLVCESIEMTDELGLRNGDASTNSNETAIEVVEKRHYITQFFPLGTVPIFTSFDVMCKYSNFGDALTLAKVEGSGDNTLVVMETGITMKGDGDPNPAPARRAFLPWGLPTFDISKLTSDGRELFKRSLEWVGGAEAVIPELLLVVKDDTNPNGDEDDRILLLEGYGYFVKPISDDASQNKFNNKMATADVVYVCDTIDPVMLGTKLLNATIGVVSEEPESDSAHGLADTFTSDTEQILTIVDTSHYITEPFTVGQLEIYTGDTDFTYLDGNQAAGIQTLASRFDNANARTLVAIAAGEALVGGGPAVGRRVKLPWGDGTTFNRLNADALTILERSVAWARGLGDDGAPDAAAVNLGYEDIFASEETLLKQIQVAMQVTLTEDGMFTSITGYFYDKDKELRYALYSDNNGEPGNLLVETIKFKPPGDGPQWSTSDLPPVALPAGTYWIAFAMDHENVKYYYETGPGQQVRYKDYDAVGKGFISSWGASDASYTRKISIYGTYTPTN